MDILPPQPANGQPAEAGVSVPAGEVGVSGPCTPHKQDGFRSSLVQNVCIVREVFKKDKYRGISRRYEFFDLTAGPGRLIDGSDGSPLIAADVLRKTLMPCGFSWRVVAFERDMERYGRLMAAAGRDPRILPLNMDCINLMTYAISDGMPTGSFGMFYFDPPTAPTWDKCATVLADASRRFDHMDILLNLGFTGYLRSRNAAGLRDVNELRAMIRKDHWLIRRPYSRNLWSMLLGTNYSQYKQYRDFVRLDSGEGRDIWVRLTTTREERAREFQPPLF